MVMEHYIEIDMYTRSESIGYEDNRFMCGLKCNCYPDGCVFNSVEEIEFTRNKRCDKPIEQIEICIYDRYDRIFPNMVKTKW